LGVVTNVIPGNLSRDEIPQFVYFSFDDAVNRMNYNLYSNLFAGRFVNPNGCPTTVSFNLCNESTNYELVRRLHRQGHEIASHSILHTNPKFWDGEMWEYEIQGMRELISDKIGIKEDEIVGMRSPFLVLGGNKQFSLLERFNYTYDASMVPAFSSNQEEPLWPFKLTGKPPRRYFFEPGTPTEAYPSVWEVPMNPYFYCPHAPDGAVSMLDGCHPGSYNATYLYLKYNFLRHYNSPSKAPFGINMHAAWFHPAWPYHFQAMEDFIGEICRLRNVYIVSVSRILKWMEDPVPLSRMSESEAVKCD
ncbi:uncharacterized protein LOC112042355, partial [Lingula anatina]|uniref:Uncharacterized protein LOC112042355 n=1 Tax=Lingula anatina TaxID=7574 RepID=A0A2R2MQP9_LINAN